MAGKAKRLNKVAKENNISISTIVEFLGTKGIEIDSKPNTKIEEDVWKLLDEEFADDRIAKQNYDGIKRENNDSITLKDVKQETEKTQDEKTSAERKWENLLQKVDESADNFIERDVKREELIKQKEQIQKTKKPNITHPEIDEFLDFINETSITTYAVGSIWGEEDRTIEFIENGVWENGDPREWGEQVKEVHPNDILIMKSTYAGKGEAYFRVKAFGKVLQNKNDGIRLIVDWRFKANNLDIAGHLGKYRRRIWPMPISDIEEVLLALKLENIFDYDLHRVYTAIELGTLLGENLQQLRTTINSDSGNKDALDFERDAKSFAALIASKDMKPPLAIALFGKWGSGKSFFMQILEQKIRELSIHQGFHNHTPSPVYFSPEKEVFVKGIAHIKFNAWSYMDANLWAGLAHSLFEKLNEYITDHTKGDLERLRVQVKIAKRLDLLHGNLGEFETKKKSLLKLRNELKKKKENKLLKYITPEYDGAILTFLEKSGMDEEHAKLFLPSKLKKYAENSIHFLSYLKANGFLIISHIVGWTLLFIVLNGAIGEVLVQFLSDSYSWIKSFWMTCVSGVIPTMLYLLGFLRKKKKIIGDIAVLSNKVANIPDGQAEFKELKKELNEIEGLIEETQKEIDVVKSENKNINELAINNLIAAKIDQKEYTKHLGIITTIRKDFETLSDLFSDREFDKTGLNPKEKARITDLEVDRDTIAKQFKGGDYQKLERIVLYIDDLDRCSDEKVMQVLEAVHLLMAFPLFTVIVGVDERCIHNALNYKYLEQHKGLNRSDIKGAIRKIQPIEYLEKIFQIPFQLPKAEQEGVNTMIDHLIPNVVKEEKTEIEESINEMESMDGQAKEGRSDYEKLNKKFPMAESLSPVAPEQITITEFEKKYVKRLSVLVGNNPRTIKRFVNIYKITKVHQNIGLSSNEDQLKMIFLVAFFLGEFSADANRLFKPNTYPDDALGMGIHEIIETSQPDSKLSSIFDALSKNKELIGVLNLEPSDLSTHFSLINRFVFTTE